MKIQPGVGHTFDSSSLGFSIDTSEQFPEDDKNVVPCPLQIYNLRYDSTASQYLINVSAGAVNNYAVYDNGSGTSAKILSYAPPPNIPVFIAGLSSPGATNYIYIAVENSGAPNYTYPSTTVNPVISVETTLQSDTSAKSYFLIGIVVAVVVASPPSTTLSVTNYKGCGSLWSERFKCGAGGVNYWWSGV